MYESQLQTPVSYFGQFPGCGLVASGSRTHQDDASMYSGILYKPYYPFICSFSTSPATAFSLNNSNSPCCVIVPSAKRRTSPSLPNEILTSKPVYHVCANQDARPRRQVSLRAQLSTCSLNTHHYRCSGPSSPSTRVPSCPASASEPGKPSPTKFVTPSRWLSRPATGILTRKRNHNRRSTHRGSTNRSQCL